MKPIHACTAVLLLSAIDREDHVCPPGTAERLERVGETATTCVTESGVRHGPFTMFNNDRVILSRGQYDQGRMVGRWQTWYSNGARHEDGHYQDGKRAGGWTRWHSNGTKSEEGDYRADYEVGVWRASDDQGALVSEIPRNLVCPPGLIWHDAAPLIDTFPPIHGLSDGRHCRRSDEVPQGPTVAWGFGRRKIAMVGWYCDGHAQGTWSFFWPTGTLAREGSFAGASRKQGTWTDWDDRARKVLEVDYDGREIARRQFPKGPEPPPVDATAMQALAILRFEDAGRRQCAAEPVVPAPYRGLREELRPADALLRIRVIGVRTPDRPPGWTDRMAPPLEEVDVSVKKVLAGSVARAGETIRMAFAPALHYRRFEELRNYGADVFWNAPHRDWDMTAIAERRGADLLLRNLLHTDDGLRTDALLTEYARLVHLDDRRFRLGLARLIAPRITQDPEGLLWSTWGSVAIDDWERVPASGPPDPALRDLVRRTHGVVLRQLDGYVASRGLAMRNLHELPWLIRQLSVAERRQTAARLVRIHDFLAREADAATREEEPPTTAAPPGAGRPVGNVRLMWAERERYEVLVCVAVCLDPTASPLSPNAKDLLDRARSFVKART